MGAELSAIAQVLRRQNNVITREQAIEAGMTRHALRHRLRDGGPWQALLPAVYLTVTGTPSRAQVDMAALLYAGPDSMLTGMSALVYHRVRVELPEMVQVLVPAARQRRDVGPVRLLRTARMPDSVARLEYLRFAPAARAVGDAVRGMSGLRGVRDIVASAVQRGRCTLSELIDELNAGPRRESALFRVALAEVVDGSRSVAEAELRKLIEQSGLEMPLFNAALYDGDTHIATPDAWYPEYGIAIEVDSKEWHLTPEDHKRTLQRGNRMQTYLINVLRFTPDEIRRVPGRVVSEIKTAIERAKGRPPLSLRTIPAPRT
ncbi:MAG TPA: hypothetical protein VKU39_15820 [Streptosporangiaceae bacterium]|nr:hypothetical protein [Streptosporangiaceae bacterium]